MSEESYILIKNIPECRVVKALSYQKEALDIAIRNNGYIKYNKDGYTFVIKPFNSSLLNDDYSDFYTFIREDNSETIISKNKEKLLEFCSMRNRLMLY
jgi:hypothetical protein